MAWKAISKWAITDGTWTISKAENVPFPYALWMNKENFGYFTSSQDAKAAITSQSVRERLSVINIAMNLAVNKGNQSENSHSM